MVLVYGKLQSYISTSQLLFFFVFVFRNLFHHSIFVNLGNLLSVTQLLFLKYCRDISKRACLASFSAPGNIVFQIIPVGFCSLQNYGILFTNNNEEESLKEMMAKDLSKEAAEIPFLIPSGEDAAVWLMVSAASVTEVQHDLQVKDHSIRWWRLALLAKNLVFMGSMLDPRYLSCCIFIH